jgi:exosortase/archaeosortase family protein
MSKPKKKQDQPPVTVKESVGGVRIGRFIATYICLMALFMLVVSYVPVQNNVDLSASYSGFIASLATRLIKLLTVIPITCQGDIINLPNISLQVSFGCNGLEAVVLYAAAVIAFPAPWLKRAAGIAAGLLVIQVFNVLRLGGLAYFGFHYKQYFDVIHIYIAQGMSIAVSLLIFFAYLNYIGRPGKHVA